MYTPINHIDCKYFILTYTFPVFSAGDFAGGFGDDVWWFVLGNSLIYQPHDVERVSKMCAAGSWGSRYLHARVLPFQQIWSPQVECKCCTRTPH